MDVTIAVTGEHPAEELRALRSWLIADEDLTGLVSLADVPADVPAGARTSARADLAVALGDRGGAAALAHALVAWIRDHTRDVVYEVARPDGVSVRVAAKRVRETGGAMVRELIAELCRPRADHDTGYGTGYEGEYAHEPDTSHGGRARAAGE